ncbi:helix-turn-helix transcriptional regulator [Micromonospora sp. S-DT3-3-22]|uniref:helix-turn-helix transcriptional regulator n=1 Tax=Micromonospora sp. S-DT3-3-22 TaxID=2755359 RepID=UPI002815BBF1|nr:helix-turn-helix transcriptional regulator [Micromonospora sp. S-DT3-3-22]
MEGIFVDPQQISDAKRALGRRLAGWRKTHGLTQDDVARRVHSTRSTVANVENGRQVVDRVFWAQCDSLLQAGGELLTGYDEYRSLEVRHQQERAEAARHARWGAVLDHRVIAEVAQHRQPPVADAEAGHREDDNSVAARLLAHLRHRLLAPTRPEQAIDPIRLPEVRQRVAHVHNLYQRGNYAETIRELPDTIEQADIMTRAGTGTGRNRAAAVLAGANLAASKVAVKLGDPSLAWIAADRAARIATEHTEDVALVAAAAFSVGTALLAMPHRTDSAEAVVTAALDHLKRTPQGRGPQALSAQGALTLLAALVAARQAQPAAAERHLNDAHALAEQVGGDRNDLWTGFGPTNVMIHRINIATRTDRPQLAIHLGEHLDTSSLPRALMSRRAQVHLDLAAAHASSSDNDPAAVLHLLEAERIAPQTVHVHARTRRLIGGLLARERRSATPGLRALAERAEIVA